MGLNGFLFDQAELPENTIPFSYLACMWRQTNKMLIGSITHSSFINYNSNY